MALRIAVKAVTLFIIVLLSLEGASALAPGDEDPICLDPRETATYEPPPDTTRVLMSSRYYEDPLGDLVWTTLDVDGDNQTWRYSTGGRCTRTVRSCLKTPGQENWLVTQYISKDISQEIDTYPVTISVDINWRISSCTGSCNRMVEVHRFLSNSEQFPDVSQRVGTSLGTLTFSADVARTTSLSFTLGVNQEGFYLGFLATGTCFTISQINVYRLRCPPTQVGLALYPDTHTPISGQVDLDSECVDNASVEASSGSLTCDSTGQWTGNPTCSCDCGYMESADSCIACSAGEYRSDSDGSCQTCPGNTINTGVGVCECPCMPGYYRAASEGPGAACTSPPSSLSCDSLQAPLAQVTSDSITVTWNRPQTTGRSDFYTTVKYSNPDDPFGPLLVAFERLASVATSLTRTISGLRAFTEYRIEVSVHNGVSDQDPDNEPERTCDVTATTLEGCPGESSNVSSLCTVVVWAPPEEPNGVIVGYDVEFRRIGTNQEIITENGPSELFLVVEGDSVPPGEGDLEFRVLPRNSKMDCDYSGFDWMPLSEGDAGCTNPVVHPPGIVPSATSVGCDTIVWEPPANTGGGITGYTVRVYFQSGGQEDDSTETYTVSDGSGWLQLNFSTLPASPIYYYQIQVFNTAGPSDGWSNEFLLRACTAENQTVCEDTECIVTDGASLVWEYPNDCVPTSDTIVLVQSGNGVAASVAIKHEPGEKLPVIMDIPRKDLVKGTEYDVLLTVTTEAGELALPCNEFKYDESVSVIGAQGSQDDDDDEYSSDDLTIAIAITCVATAIVATVTVVLVALVVYSCRMQKIRKKYVTNGVHATNQFQLSSKT